MGGAEPGEAGGPGGRGEGEGCGWVEKALAALVALDPGLASEARVEGCAGSWRSSPGGVVAWEGASRLPPRERLAQLAWALARSRALRLLEGAEAPLPALVVAVEAHAHALAERLGLPGPLGLVERTLLSIAFPAWRRSGPGETALALAEAAREVGLRGIAARILLRVEEPRSVKLIESPGEGRGALRAASERPSRPRGVAVKALRALRLAMPAGEGRGWLRPSKRLQAVADKDLVVPGYTLRPSASLAVYLDVSASMEGPKWEEALETAEAVLAAAPAQRRSLIAFDDGVRLVVENPLSLRSLPLVPSGGTKLHKALERFQPCHARMVAIVSDWGLDEEDLASAASWLRAHVARGCRALLVSVSRSSEPPRGPWLVVKP